MSDEIFLEAGRYEIDGHSFVLARDVMYGAHPMPDDFAEIDGKPVTASVGDVMPDWLAQKLCGATVVLTLGNLGNE